MVTMVACEWICESALLMLDTNWSVTVWLDTKFNALCSQSRVWKCREWRWCPKRIKTQGWCENIVLNCWWKAINPSPCVGVRRSKDRLFVFEGTCIKNEKPSSFQSLCMNVLLR